MGSWRKSNNSGQSTANKQGQRPESKQSNTSSQSRWKSASPTKSHRDSNLKSKGGLGDDLRTLNVYAEVRGKYARPPPALNFTPLSDSKGFAASDNPITKRPSTAGSLVGIRNREANRLSLKNPELDKKVTKEESARAMPREEQEERARAYSRSKNHKRTVSAGPKMSHRIIGSVRAQRENGRDEVNRLVLDEPEQREHVDEENNEEENSKDYGEEDKDKVDELDGRSQASWITTSSQRRYIQELENLLKEERVKRLKAEEAVKKLNSKN
jgi:hypothetical protein